MKKSKQPILLTAVVLFGAIGGVDSSDLIRSLSKGDFTTKECLSTYNIRSLSNGECSTMECLNKYNIRIVSDGECSTMECLDAYNIKYLSNNECSTISCLRVPKKVVGTARELRGRAKKRLFL